MKCDIQCIADVEKMPDAEPVEIEKMNTGIACDSILTVEDIPGVIICNQDDNETEILKQFKQEFMIPDNQNVSTEPRNEMKNDGVSKIIFNYENETANERKVRLGEMTPFGTVLQSSPYSKNQEFSFSKYLEEQEKFKNQKKNANVSRNYNKRHVRVKSVPHSRKRRKKLHLGTETVDYCSKKPDKIFSEKMTIDFNESSGSEYIPSTGESNSSDDEKNNINEVKISSKARKKRLNSKKYSSDEYCSESDSSLNCSSRNKFIDKVKDDGDENEYEYRLEAYKKSCDESELVYHEFNDFNFKIPLETWSKLYNYQKVGVQWLYELHQQGVGGILGDEMGLGKSIQIISFLSGLYYSRLKNKYFMNIRGLGASLLVCPTTLMYQWVKEFHKWLPPVRIAVLHSSGSFIGAKKNLIKDIYRNRGIIITSYTGLLQFNEHILRYNWHYAILDEGHKIRNPDAKITLYAKQIKTPHRLILSGSPLQNNLEELWSLFDFIYPGKLGSLPVFQAQFSIPITHGGYANASDVEVTIAYKCATVLKELIAPFLLRRAKSDIRSHINLPEKNEQILFCRLTDAQRDLYQSYVDSKEVNRILEGEAKIFVGLINLRKICNHPDLFIEERRFFDDSINVPKEEQYGYWKKSGKMIVLETLLRIWYKQNHKVLLFSQSKKMLNILEIFIKSFNYSYLKMDGSTCITSRQPLIDKFNNDSTYFIMLLTTKVGGLGINLTSASRVVIYDPDWNPATDSQARERAWRIGQTQNVTIYRFITVGTIEEKIYHRQIFKQFLTNKVLKDPKQRRFFKSNDLFELFSLKESNVEGSTETGAIFAGTATEINLNSLKVKRKLREEKLKERLIRQKLSSKKEKMKLLAQQISQKLSEKNVRVKENIKAVTEHSLSSNLKLSNDKNTENNSSIDVSKKLESIEDVSDSKKHVCSVTTNETNNCVNTDEDLKQANKVFDSKKRKEKHKKEKYKKSYFEGEFVPHLVHLKNQKAVQTDTENKNDEVEAIEDEYVLKKLFSKAGICSALQHDKIMEGGPTDYALVEKEAEKVAQEAINELRRSQELCFPAQSGIPNWTGKHGTQSKSNANVLSSKEILERIRKRNGEVAVANSETQILRDIKKFIISEGGTASTSRLIEIFEKQLPASMTPLFKCLLNKICTFYRAPDEKGYWTLKTEFQNYVD